MAVESPKEWSTHSGIPLKDLYTPEDIKGLDYERDLGYPGQPPYSRGVYKTMYRGQHFTIRRFTGVETPEQTNELYKEELRLGQNGLAIAPDVPTSTALDSDNPRCEGDVGFCGVPIDTVEDMEIIFKDILIDCGERPKEDANIIKCNWVDMIAFSGLVGINVTARRLRYGNRFER